MTCPHQTLKKLSDKDQEVLKPFPSWEEGFRLYECANPECGQMLKAKEAQAHVVEETK